MKRQDLPAVPNLRDVGGVPTSDGTMRSGLIYRSVALNRLDPATADQLGALGIGTVADLRTLGEQQAAPDVLWPSANLMHLDVFADQPGDTGARLAALFTERGQLHDFVRSGDAERFMDQTYRDFIRLPSARRAWRTLLLSLDTTSATLVHCTAGKDRTGWAVALIQLIAGVPRQEIYREYLRSNDALLPLVQPLLSEFDSAGGSREQLLALLGVSPEYLDTSLQEMTAAYGDLDGFLIDGLSLDHGKVSALKQTLAEPAR